MLVTLEYLDQNDQNNADATARAMVEAFEDYEQGINWYLGQRLWKDHGDAFEEHFRYFMYSIVKPYDMRVETFDHEMKLYGEKIKLMQPPSKKKASSFLEADWEAQKQIIPQLVRKAIFYGLPKPYQDAIKHSHETDYRDMDDAEFIQAMADYEGIDDNEKEKKKVKFAQEHVDKKKKV